MWPPPLNWPGNVLQGAIASGWLSLEGHGPAGRLVQNGTCRPDGRARRPRGDWTGVVEVHDVNLGAVPHEVGPVRTLVTPRSPRSVQMCRRGPSGSQSAPASAAPSTASGIALRSNWPCLGGFAAYGAVAGIFYSPTCDRAPPQPIVYFHCTADALVPIDGKVVSGISVAPARQSMADWAGHNGCSAGTHRSVIASDVTLLTWSGCPASADVDYYIIAGGGHSCRERRQLSSGPPTHILRAHDREHQREPDHVGLLRPAESLFASRGDSHRSSTART